MNPPIPLIPGDVLLYSKSDIFGLFTAFRTWSPAVHVEMYEGSGVSIASRNGIGVNRYLFRRAQLAAVLRPNQPVDMEKIRKWFGVRYPDWPIIGVMGRPYGWLDLLRFYGMKIPTNGWICSQFVAKACRAGGLKAFAENYNEGTIDPGDYFTSPAFDWFWVRPDVLRAVAD
jgi:hypothetical protein